MNLSKKLNKYQEILRVLCETDEEIDHAVLVTAHKVADSSREYDTTISTFRCDMAVAQSIMHDADRKLQFTNIDHTGKKVQ